MASAATGTFGITGMPVPKDAVYRTSSDNHIPYVTGMPLRYEITDFWMKMNTSGDKTMKMQWTLFIKGLERFKAIPIHEKLSYFQVAGIHGSPGLSWDGAEDPPKTPKGKQPPGANPFGGYCHHNTVAFPTWHRPYMVLFEQCVWLNMLEVIDKWVTDEDLSAEDSIAWKSAADTWRMFYWDWAKKQIYPDPQKWNDFGIPFLFTLQFITIFPPTGQKNDCPNPLYTFENPEKDFSGNPLPFGSMPEGKEKYNLQDSPPEPTKDAPVPLPWSKCSAISRWGIVYDKETKKFSGLTGNNDWQKCNKALSTTNPRFYKPRRGGKPMEDPEWALNRPKDLADAVSRMFCTNYIGSWGTFASTKWYAEEQAKLITGYASLEYIHNNIHNITGGSALSRPVEKDPKKPTDPSVIWGAGQMCSVPVAAFDPIFWMHHANVDRFTAMWQCLNWDKWFEPEPGQQPGQQPSQQPSQEPGQEPSQPVQVPDVKPDDPLEPFHRTTGGDPEDYENKWTSELARDWTDTGYQYDNLMPKSDAVKDGALIADKYLEQLRKAIKDQYPGSDRKAADIWNDNTIRNATFCGEKTTEREEFEDYLINVVYDRYALDGQSYSIDFYVSDYFVGHIYSLGGMSPGAEIGCANCGNQKNAKVLSRGQVPISMDLMRMALDDDIPGLTTILGEHVHDFLAENLTMEYVAVTGGILSEDLFPNTKVSVLAGKGTWIESDEPGVYLPPYYDASTYRVLTEATQKIKAESIPIPEGSRLSFTPQGMLDDVEVQLPA